LISKNDHIERQHEHLLWVLSAATFLIFFQAFMVAPLIPRLAAVFGVSDQAIGLIVPAYMIAYGISTLFYGLLSDRIGRGPILLASLLAFLLLTLLTATSQSASQMIFWRLLTGLGASGVVPVGLTLIGDLFPYERRGRPLGWLFGAMAGGMAFGSTVGVMLEPFIGWRMLFVGVAALAAMVLGVLLHYRPLLGGKPMGGRLSIREVLASYRLLLASLRGLRTYAYVFVNAIFHSGVYTWLGLYFARRYGLGEVGIGLAILGYGVPGFLLGPVIGKAADRWGRRWLVPAGLAVSAVAAGVLMLDVSVWMAAVAVALLSLGYDMTQPLLAGIVTTLGGKRGGQAMGLNVFLLFTGFGLGSFLFGEALRSGFTVAFAIFAGVQGLTALAAIPLFRFEKPFALPAQSAGTISQ
jgi:predicted MFS family arabinose efflux permease